MEVGVCSFDEVSCYIEGYKYEFGIGRKQNESEAIKYYSKSFAFPFAFQSIKHKATTLQNVQAQFVLARIYSTSTPFKQNFTKAKKYYKRAAQMGNSYSQYHLGWLYLTKGTTSDMQKAAKWFKCAADQGNSHAHYYLGWMYTRGRGMHHNYLEAIKCFKAAAKQGHSHAQYEIGWMYEVGKGVKQNSQKSAKWYRLAAEEGDVEAQSTLAAMYMTGRGLLQNIDEAVKWYKAAANQGDAEAPYVLGVLFRDGKDSLEQNEEEALRWFRIAMEKEGESDAWLQAIRIEKILIERWIDRFIGFIS